MAETQSHIYILSEYCPRGSLEVTPADFWNNGLHKHMMFLSQNLYDVPDIAPHVDFCFLGQCDFRINFSKCNKSRDALNRSQGNSMVNMEISQMLNEILKLDHVP